MAQVDANGVAASVLDVAALDVDQAAGARVLLRAAAWSMLHEPPDHAADAWAQCLIVPQGALGASARSRRRRVALAVAATQVVGFRAAFARRPLSAEFVDRDPGIGVDAALRDAPDRAAAAGWHCPRSAIDATVCTLATRAALHHDPTLAEYTLACFDAAGWDRSQQQLYLAAASSLHAWWACRTQDDDALDPVA